MNMMEVIGALLIALIIVGGAAYGLNSAFSKSKVSSMEQDLVTMRMQTQQLFSGSTDYAGLENELAIKAGIVPKGLVKGTDLKNPWGGVITLGANAANASFTVELTEIPSDECAQLGMFQRDAWLGVTVNGAEIAKDAGVADVVANCQNTNTILYEGR